MQSMRQFESKLTGGCIQSSPSSCLLMSVGDRNVFVFVRIFHVQDNFLSAEPLMNSGALPSFLLSVVMWT